MRADGDQGYAQAAEEMDALAAKQPGYLGVESARDAGGLGITVSYWADEAAAAAWKQVAEHLAAQRRGREAWYREYRVRVASVGREYGSRSPGRGEDDSNARTIAAYNARARQYADNSPGEVPDRVRQWMDRAVRGVPRTARILELGSATGRDAAYLRGLGYQVEATDATPAFIDMLRARGIEARPLNAITDPLPSGLDVVLANAVLLHFTRDQAAHVMAKVHAALRPGGRFALTLKRGEGEAWSTEKLAAPRYFCYWTSPQVTSVLAEAGFADIDVEDRRYVRTGQDWLHIVAQAAR